MGARADSINVLHVDDEPEFAEMVATFVERADDRFEVDTAPSANEGLDRLAEDEYQCVVSDYDMPGQNGIELLEAVRETYPDLPFILYTGKGSEEVASDAISAGATDYLQKESGTGQYEVLANRINNAVSQARSQQAERHLRELAENTNQILYIFNHDWSELVFINAAYEDIWGRPVETLRNDPTDFLSGIHPDDRDHVREAMNRMSGGETVRIEYRVNPSEDYERWVSVRGEPIVDETGTVVRVAGLAIDITDRKRQEQELERIRDFFKEAERLGDIGAWEFDSTGGVFWSEGTRRIHEVDDDFQPSIETGIEFFRPDDRSAIEQAVQSSLDTGESFDEEGRLITAENNQRWVKIRGEPLADGETVRGYIQDITEQKEREGELELAETVFEHAQDAIFVVDVVDETEFRVERVNPAYERRTGLDAKEIRGKSPRDIVGDEFGATIEARYRECVTEQAPMEYEETIPLAGDTTHWQTTLAPVVADGTVVRLVGATRDITERKRQQQELERNRDLLRHAERVASVGAVEIDPHSEEVRWTDGTRTIHGVADDYEPSVETALDFYQPDDREAVRRDFDRCLETGEPYHGEYRLQTADDEIRWVEIHGEAVQEDGDTVLVRGAIQDITKYKEREQELERTRTKFKRVFEESNNAIFISDIENDRIVDCNQAAADLVGVPRDELRSMSPSDLHPHNYEAVKEWVEPVLEEGSGRTDEITCRRPDGEIIPVEMSAGVAEFDGSRCLVNNVVDISERKERERKLEQQRRRFETVFEYSNDAIFVLDVENDAIRNANPRAADLLGYSREELVSSVAISDIHGDHMREFRAFLDTVLEEGHGRTDEFHCNTKSGDVVEAEISMTPIDLEGTTYLLASVRDITDRQRRERVLREMYDIIADHEQSFEEQIQALLELGREELDTRYGTLSEIRDEDYIFEFVAAADDSIHAGDVVPVEATNCELVASTEETVVLDDVERDAPAETDRAGFTERGIASYIGAPVVVDDDVYGTFCFYDTEARAGQFSEWEQTLVELMSRWVSYELQRRETTKRLQEQNEQLEQFTSIVSHDLRNPLKVAEGRLQLAQEECDSEQLVEVRHAHERMRTLIDDLLTLAQEGTAISEYEWISLESVVEGCWATVETADGSLQIESEQTIQADPTRLRQVFENLFRNAVEHSGDDVSISVGDLNGGFYVEDDGPGIAEDEREEVFEAGYSTASTGTGFGLSIVKEIIDAHGWQIHVTDGSEGGARFEITQVDVATA